MARVDLIVMDLAGTTVHDPDFVGVCVQEALSAVGLDLPIATINPIMGMPKPVALRQLLSEADHSADVEAVHADFVAKMNHLYTTSPEVRPIAGAEQTIAELRANGVKVALDTGFSRDIVTVLLERLGWTDDFVDATVASDEVPRGRPFPDMVFRAMDIVGTGDVKRVAKVGDTPSDIGEGLTAGCSFVVGVLSGTHTRAQLEAHSPTHILDSIVALPDLIL